MLAGGDTNNVKVALGYKFLSFLFITGILGIIFTLFPAILYAQGPEESCGVPYQHPNYSDIVVVDEPIDALHGWVGNFDSEGRACFSGNTYTEYYKLFTVNELPDAHSAATITLDGHADYATGVVVASARLGGAQDIQYFDSGLCTTPEGCDFSVSGMYAQGVTHVREIRIVARSARGGCLDYIRITPTGNITSHSSIIPDADVDGVDYPAWHRVISSTLVEEYGSRIVDGALQIGNQPICTPIHVTRYTDTLSVSVAVQRISWPNLRAVVVANMADALSAEYGPAIHPQSATTYTVMSMDAKISPDVSDGGYLCLLTEHNLSIVDWVAPSVCYNADANCPILSNADFTTPTNWTITNTASISGGALHLPAPGDYATQPINIADNAYYDVVLTATGTTSDTDRLLVSLGGSDSVLILSDTLRTYNTLISTQGADTISPTLRLENLTGGSIIDYICFTRVYSANETVICIAPENGEFEDNSAWSFYHGGQWNAADENALLPIDTEGAISQSVTLPILPEVEGGNYWILSFDAKSRYGDGTTYVSLDGPDFTDSLTFTLGTAFQTYEVDASAYSESTWGLFFANLNIPGYITSESDVLIDNVCIHWSPDPPADPPPPRGPPQMRDIPTITLTIDITCAEVSTWLSDTIGIDFTALETEEPPEDLDILGSWIWWLASKLWLYVAKPIICFLLFLWNLLAGMIEKVINFLIVNFLNPLLHTVNDLMLWLYAIYLFIINFANDPFGSLKAIIKAIWDEYIWPVIEPIVNWFKAMWDDVIWPVLQPWLQPLIDAILNLWDWIQNTLWPWLHDLWVDPLGTIGALISNALQALIDWLFDMLRPIWDVFQWMLWLVGRFVGIIALILWPLWWAWDFARTLIPGLIDAITNAAQIAPLELGDFATGYTFINDILTSTPFGAVILVINGVLWFVFIRWAIGQFSNLNT